VNALSGKLSRRNPLGHLLLGIQVLREIVLRFQGVDHTKAVQTGDAGPSRDISRLFGFASEIPPHAKNPP
jgi:hypothetical protein